MFNQRILLFSILAILLGNFQVDGSSEELLLPNADETASKGYQLLLGSNTSTVAKVPHFVRNTYGQLGVNYDMDHELPFIWCEHLNSSCTGPVDQCLQKVKCFPEKRSHLLGCMAVYVYNVRDAEASNQTVPPNALMLKGCWSQYESELRECVHDVECVTHTRRTGAAGRAAKFCCCRTHYCNQNLTFASKETEAQRDRDLETTTPPLILVEELRLLPNILSTSTAIFIFVSIFFFVCLLIVSVFSIWCVRKKRRHYDVTRMKLSECVSSPQSYLQMTNECHALLGGKSLNLKNAQLRELLSSGHFSELYRAQVDDVSVAVRVYNSSDSDGWMNEQDIFTLKALRSHDNIVDYLAAIQQGQQYWCISRYYQNGSVYDYLHNNTLSAFDSSKIISTMLSGLAFLHEECYVYNELKPSIVHRDFKSKNVLLKSDLSACISDFGYAVKCENGRMANEENQAQVGTRRYMSPEILEGATEFSGFAFQQVDVYAASLVMWEILSRTRVPERPEEVVPEYMLPFEREIGKQPTLGRLRELVVLRKFRPLSRESLFENASLSRIIKTMRDMWDSEPDGRITSSCARDRVSFCFKSSLESVPYNARPSPLIFGDINSITSSGGSYHAESAISSFDCPSATGTTIPMEAQKSVSQNLTSSSSIDIYLPTTSDAS
ncbi:TKL/STKR/TYPE2 protein kinase [Aphelenchoides besseyi]|nr:TKL/STKR/TYPE2 protein kinase [Aphelenchoides besseyi]KAI6235721.1 TKL/STKR/TYPE2 protein kinase [Aphelenchoides besseyi]